MRFYLIWCGTTTWGEIDFSERNFRLRIQLVHNAIRSIKCFAWKLRSFVLLRRIVANERLKKTKTITFFLKKELLKEEIFTILLQSQLN